MVEQFTNLTNVIGAQFEFNLSSDTLDRDGEFTRHDSLPLRLRNN